MIDFLNFDDLERCINEVFQQSFPFILIFEFLTRTHVLLSTKYSQDKDDYRYLDNSSSRQNKGMGTIGISLKLMGYYSFNS